MATTDCQPQLIGGYTFTLASWISTIMRELESECGAPEPGWFFCGYEFVNGTPQIWFPYDCHHVIIQLTLNSKNDWGCAAYELAHECVHLLAPRRLGTNLEEGFAVRYAESFQLRHTGTSFLTSDARYLSARDAVNRLLALKATAIRELRQRNLSLSALTAADMLAVVPTLSAHDADFLSQPFPPPPVF